MVENVEQTRREHVERMNGRLATWWYYNNFLVMVLMFVCCGSVWLIRQERAERLEIERRLEHAARHLDAMSCYSTERSTSLIIAGGSRKHVNEALIDAAAFAREMRMTWMFTQEARK